MFQVKAALFYVMCGLLTVVLALIIVGGIDLGLFLNAGDSTSNGIAHFGGFITLLILFFLYDVRTEKRKYFQLTFGMAVGMGIVWYANYLFTLIRQVKGI